jgi:Plasmid encoded RepA protein
VIFPHTLQQRLDDARENCHAPELSGFVPVRPILDSISITNQRIRQLDAIHLVREQRENGNQDLAFHARPFVLCGIPLRRPPANELVHRRRNGKFFLEIIAHPRFGLPFGQDRLIPIWAATLAVKQKSRTVHFDSAAQLLEFLQLPKDGTHYRRIVQGFQRIFGASIFFGTDNERKGSHVFDWARFHFFDRMELWFNRANAESVSTPSKPHNVITLSTGFFDEINQHPIPVERPVVTGLVNAPGLLDLYVWIVWKSWTVKTVPVRIPLFGPLGLEQQLGSARYSRNKRFRQTLRRWLRSIRLLWPACPAELSADGRFLIVHSSCHSPAIRRENG